VRIVHNASVSSFDQPDQIRDALVQQLDHPVRWIETIERLAASGVTRIVECGPGKVLTGLSKRIATGVECVAITDSAALAAATRQG
jgi:[acyl-carrier-protein] S-malonyltransferase